MLDLGCFCNLAHISLEVLHYISNRLEQRQCLKTAHSSAIMCTSISVPKCPTSLEVNGAYQFVSLIPIEKDKRSKPEKKSRMSELHLDSRVSWRTTSGTPMDYPEVHWGDTAGPAIKMVMQITAIDYSLKVTYSTPLLIGIDAIDVDDVDVTDIVDSMDIDEICKHFISFFSENMQIKKKNTKMVMQKSWTSCIFLRLAPPVHFYILALIHNDPSETSCE